MGNYISQLPGVANPTGSDTLFVETNSGPQQVKLSDLKETMKPPPAEMKGEGNATAAQVLQGYTFSNNSCLDIQGSMPNRGVQEIWKPTTSTSKTIQSGYYPSSFTLDSSAAYTAGYNSSKDYYKANVRSACSSAGISVSSSATWETMINAISNGPSIGYSWNSRQGTTFKETWPFNKNLNANTGYMERLCAIRVYGGSADSVVIMGRYTSNDTYLYFYGYSDSDYDGSYIFSQSYFTDAPSGKYFSFRASFSSLSEGDGLHIFISNRSSSASVRVEGIAFLLW